MKRSIINQSKRTARDIKYLLFFLALIWLLELVNLLFDHQLNQFALVPRQVNGLFGIVTMHFLHWGLPHLIANTIPVAILGFLICMDGKFLNVSVSIMLITGVLVWLFARNGVHAGASGLIFGYWGYLLSGAYFERSIKNVILAIFTILIYGGIAFSLLDFRSDISFEGHLFGLLAGILSAWFWRTRTIRK